MRSAGAGDGDWIRAAATGKGGHYTLRGVRTAAYDLEAPHPSRLSESRVRVTGRPVRGAGWPCHGAVDGGHGARLRARYPHPPTLPLLQARKSLRGARSEGGWGGARSESMAGAGAGAGRALRAAVELQRHAAAGAAPTRMDDSDETEGRLG